MKKLYFLIITLLVTSLSFSQIVINEIDADQTSTDTEEFIELKWTPSTSLDGFVVVLFNGSDDQSYAAYDLDGKSTDTNGFFILASTALISGSDIDLGTDNGLQNGADAVAVYQANDTDFPNDTPITMTNLIDVLVYGTGDPDDAGLLVGFGETVQYDEGANGLKDTESLQRTDDGSTYETKLPTFRADNYTTDPTLFIVDGPANGSATIGSPEDGGDIDIYFGTTNFTVATPPANDGYIVWEVKNSGNTTIAGGNDYDTSTPNLFNMPQGDTYTLNAELVDPSGASLSPAVIYAITFTVPEYIQVANLAALRASTIGDDLYYQVTGEVVGTFMQTYRNQRYIQDATAGILVDDPDLNEPTTYDIGDGVINIKGQLSTFNGVLQFTPVRDAPSVPVNSTGNVITPEVVTNAELAANWENYESELIEIQGATFVGASGNFATGTNYTLNDGTGDLTFRTNFFDADYIGMPIPLTAQNLVVLVAEFNGSPQVTARELSDLTLRVGRNDIDGFSLYPNPVTNGKVMINTINNGTKEIQIFNILGKSVISTNLKGKELNVSKLHAGIYILKIQENGKTATRKLVIK